MLSQDIAAMVQNQGRQIEFLNQKLQQSDAQHKLVEALILQMQTASEVQQKQHKEMVDLLGKKFSKLTEAVDGIGQKMQDASAANLSKQAEGLQQAAQQAAEQSAKTEVAGEKIDEVGQQIARVDTSVRESINSISEKLELLNEPSNYYQHLNQQRYEEARRKQSQEIFDKMETISFGNKSLQPEYSYPKIHDMPELLSKQTIKIDTVYVIKRSVFWPLAGMQFKFTENLTTKLFQTDWARDNTQLEQFSLDPTKRITQVSVYINDYHHISGLRFHYETGDYQEHKWDDSLQNPRWETETIPDGYEIVGYFACPDPSNERLWTLFGFNLWPIDRKLKL